MKIKRSTLLKIEKIVKRIFFTFIIVGIIYLFFWFLLGDISKINNVIVNGAKPVTKNLEVTPIISKSLLEQKRLFFIPANNISTYDKKKIIEIISEDITNAESIDIKSKGLHALDIQIISRTPVFNLPAQAGLPPMVLDKNGIIYKELTGTSSLPYLIASSTPNADEIIEMNNFIKKINTRLFDISTVQITEDNDIYFFNKNQNSLLKYHKGDNTTMLWDTLISALDTPPLSNLLQNKISELEYVDLRFGNKVFYKFRTGNKKDIVPSINTTNNNENDNQTSSERILENTNR